MNGSGGIVCSIDRACACFLFASLVLWVSDVEAVTEGVVTVVIIVMWAVGALLRGR